MNQYNPKIHHRRSIRLKGYDYSQEGAYFITICCENRINRFGEIPVGASLADAQMILNEFGQIAYNEWIKLSERFTNFELDVFQIMPNHMHGIIILNNVRATLAVAQTDDNNDTQNSIANNDITQNDNAKHGQPPHGQPQGIAPTIGDIIGAYKSLVANGCLKIAKSKNITMGKLWQRNYYEHIIRNEQAYQTISNYIINNPTKWNEDKFHKK